MVAISPNGTKFAVEDPTQDAPPYLIDSDEADNEKVIKLDRNYVSVLAFPPDGNLLATGDDNDVILWNVRDNAKQMLFPGHSSFISDLAFPPNGKLLASADIVCLNLPSL